MDYSTLDRLYTAREVVPPGTYIRVDSVPERRMTFHRAEMLPPAFDGTIAVYRRIMLATDVLGLRVLIPEESSKRREQLVGLGAA
jgi:hypothetical protein